jgi:hypothetical protein
MESKQEAIEFYLPKKKSGSMSLGDIRFELKENTGFTEEEISNICTSISDQELAELNKSKSFSFNVLNSIYFNIFMIMASIAIFIYSFLQFDALVRLSDTTEIAKVDYLIPIGFMVMSIIYLFRHFIQIIKRKRSV